VGHVSVQKSAHFLPFFYRPAESRDERAPTKMGKVLVHVVLAAIQLCSLTSGPACHAVAGSSPVTPTVRSVSVPST